MYFNTTDEKIISGFHLFGITDDITFSATSPILSGISELEANIS
jgi:hypothetical protein